MSILKKALATALLAFGVSSAAHATWLSGSYITTEDPFSTTIAVAQQQGTKIESAKLALLLSDPMDYWLNTRETLTVKFDNVVAGTIHNVGYGMTPYVFDVLPSLLDDGKLKLSLSLGCNNGAFRSCSSQDVWLHEVLLAITRVPTTPAVPVPPPAKPPLTTPTVPSTPAVPNTPSVPQTPAVPNTPPATSSEPAAPTPATPVDSNPPLATLPVPPTQVAPVGPVVSPDLPTESGNTPAAPAEVPEPATVLMLGLGMLGLAAARRRN